MLRIIGSLVLKLICIPILILGLLFCFLDDNSFTTLDLAEDNLCLNLYHSTVVNDIEWENEEGIRITFLACENNSVPIEEDIENQLPDGSWKELPLTDNEVKLKERILDSDGYMYFPDIENGYYYFLDFHAKARDMYDDSKWEERDSYHLILAIYDKDTEKLYYSRYESVN